MKTLVLALIVIFTVVSGYGQTAGVIECGGRTSVSSWEAPDSIVVIEQLDCGSQVPVVGEEKGFYRIQVRRNVFAYIEAEYVRIFEDPRPGAASGRMGRAPEKDPPDVPSLSLQPATEAPEVPRPPRRGAALLSGLEIGLDASYMRYEEPDFMQQDGVAISLWGAYTFRPEKYMVRFDGRMGFSDMEYSSGVSGEVSGIRDYVVEAGARFGRTFQASDAWQLTPFAGFGYRYLYDGFGEKMTSNEYLGYNRKSNYLYTPIGLEIDRRLKQEWALVTALEYNHFWHGWQHSDLGIFFENDYTAVNDQADGWGMSGSAKFVRQMGMRDIVFGPYFKYWNIKDSNTVFHNYMDEEYGFMEPANTSIEIGGRFGVRF